MKRTKNKNGSDVMVQMNTRIPRRLRNAILKSAGDHDRNASEMVRQLIEWGLMYDEAQREVSA